MVVYPIESMYLWERDYGKMKNKTFCTGKRVCLNLNKSILLWASMEWCLQKERQNWLGEWDALGVSGCWALWCVTFSQQWNAAFAVKIILFGSKYLFSWGP